MFEVRTNAPKSDRGLTGLVKGLHDYKAMSLTSKIFMNM